MFNKRPHIPMVIEPMVIEPMETRHPMFPERLFERLQRGGLIWPVGSQEIEGAATPTSDYDFLVLTKKRIPEVFINEGFNLETGAGHYDPSEGKFNSWRNHPVNVIATNEVNFAWDFLIAQKTAQRLKLTKREDRVILFQSILYKNVQS